MKKNYLTYLKSTKYLTLKLFFFAAFALLFGAQQTSASHLAGGNITYTCSSGNTYTVKLTIYRDCAGIALATPSLSITNTCIPVSTLPPPFGNGNPRSVSPSSSLPKVLITPTCNGAPTRCNGGTAPGIEKYEFIYNVTLTAAEAACADIIFAYQANARNVAITTLTVPDQQDLYVDAHLNPVDAPCNTSPGFAIDPILFLCLNQANCFSYGAIEPNGDSLSYAFITPRQAVNTNVAYSGGFNATQSITGLQTIDAATGDICMTPTATGQVAVFAMRVTERRLINGTWTIIGSVMRDIQLYMVSCNNQLPTLTGVNSTTNYTYNACAGGQICFNVASGDANAGDSTRITAGTLPTGGTFTVATGKNQSGTYCQNTTAADNGKTFVFTLTVRDNACPTNGQQSYTYRLVLGGLTATATGTNPGCSGNDGTATASPSGGSYVWSNGQNTQTATGLSAGTYTATVTLNGCSGTTPPVILTGSTVLVASATSTNPTCNGGSNGTATASPSGGTYLWSNGQTTRIATGLSAGIAYTATVTLNGCSGTTPPVTLTNPPALVALTSSTPIGCFGGANGTATVTGVTNGVGPFIYQWSPGSKAGQTINSLTAGTYTAFVTDSKGCTATQAAVVTQPALLTSTITNLALPNCGIAGSFTIVAAGGTGTYTYTTNTSPAQATANVTNVNPGTYTVTVRDQSGCRAGSTVIMPVNANLTATSSQVNPACNGDNGSACIIPAGSPGPYTYLWSNGQTTACATGLAAGTYSATVSNAAGCSASVNVTITQPAALVLNETHIDPTLCICNNINIGGSINTTVSGGTFGYTYAWSNGAATPNVSGLAGGTFTVTITDANKCTAAKTVVLTQAVSMVATSSHTNATCSSSNDGAATVTVTGGRAPYTYLWSNGVTTATTGGLIPGYYTVRVTDALGCKVFVTEVIGYDAVCRTSQSGVVQLQNTFHSPTIVVYPNPANDLINIAISGIKGDIMVSSDLTDMIGNKVMSQSGKSATYDYNGSINLSHLPPGIYMLRIQYQDEVKTVRVVKQ